MKTAVSAYCFRKMISSQGLSVFDIIKKAEYNGFLTLEFEGWEDTEQAIKAGFYKLQQLVNL